MMEDELVDLDGSNYGLIENNKTRIENLFDVLVNLKKDGGKWKCSLSNQAHSSPESIVKAKIYINSLVGEGEGYSTSIITYDVKLVEMIIQHRDEIERNTAVVVLPGQQPNDITLHGPFNHLLIAKNVIENLLSENLLSQSVDSQNSVNLIFNTQSVSSHTTLPESNKQTNLGNLTSLGRFNEQLISPNNEELHRSSNVGFSRPQISSQCRDNSTDSSETEDVILDIQSDPDYDNKVEFALKLGYQESDLVRALYNVGVDADQNELLSELIKQGSSSDAAAVQDADVQDGQEHVADGLGRDFPLVGNTMRSRKDGSDNLRHVIIDGSNIAMSHGNKETFSCQGIKLAVDWFREKGHKDITVFVPQWRKETSRSDSRMKDQAILNELEKDKVLVFTPARRIGGKRVVCYDDRYILKLAVDTDGIVVSNDNYRDLSNEKPEFKKVVEERLLMYSFVNDRFMPPDDPLGRNGPTLEAFLQKEPPLPKSLPQLCPYGSKKCTYGNKCKYYHPEKRNVPQKSVTEKLAEQAKQRMLEVKERGTQEVKKPGNKMSLCRARSLNPAELRKDSELGLMGSNQSTSSTELDKRDNEEKLFNQKLAENLRKMALEKDMKDNQPKTPEKMMKKKIKDNQSSPRWNLQHGGVSPRGASPISNLNIPGLEGEFDDDDDKFLCGHLLLAKKLSDEANESDKQRKQSEKTKKESPLVSGQSANLSYHFSEIPQTSKEPKKPKQKLQRAPQKQALSRQLSLQGTEDPRIKQEHGHLKPQYSYGGATQQSISKMQNPDEINSLMKDFMQGQSLTFGEQQTHPRINEQQVGHDPGHGYVKKSALSRMSSEGFTPTVYPDYQNTLNIPAHHTPLARMQSAPDSYMLKKQQQVQTPPRMTRQNSSSDTQLNKLEGVEEPLTYISPNQPAYNTGIDPMSGRGHVPGLSQPLSYQMRGPILATPGVHGRPMDSNPQPHPHLMTNINPQYPLNQQVNPQMFGLNHQQMMVVNRAGSSSYNPTSQTIGLMYQQTLPTSQSMYGPVSSTVAGLGHTTNQPPQQSVNMNRRGSRPGGSQLGLGPPHFLDQQTSRIWGMDRALPASSHYSQAEQINFHSLSPMSSNTQNHQQNRASPVLGHYDGISPNDPRYELYCNLCKLFPPDKVLAVMVQHPELNRPDEICAYLIGAK